MMPGLGEKYDVEIEITSNAKAEYLTDNYFALDLPVAPAIVVGEERVTEGQDIDDSAVEVEICRQLGLPEPVEEKKSLVSKLLGGEGEMRKNVRRPGPMGQISLTKKRHSMFE